MCNLLKIGRFRCPEEKPAAGLVKNMDSDFALTRGARDPEEDLFAAGAGWIGEATVSRGLRSRGRGEEKTDGGLPFGASMAEAELLKSARQTGTIGK